MTAKGFRTGGAGVFTCQSCERRTRETTQGFGEDRFCGECYELFGIQNSLWDCGPEAWIAPARDQLVKRIKQLGGDTLKVARENPDIFKLESI